MGRPDAGTRQGGYVDWTCVKRVLVVKLRSIGDTVLSTPSLIALKRFVPKAQIDILLEDWVAPLLEGHVCVDNVISVGRGSAGRLRVALELSRRKYDVAFNLHGGTTASFFTAASRAKHRVGYADYQYSFLYNHLLPSASEFWQTEVTHSAEQQLALLGFVGVPVEDRPRTKLYVSNDADERINARLISSAAPLDPVGSMSSVSGSDDRTIKENAEMQKPARQQGRIDQLEGFALADTQACAPPNEIDAFALLHPSSVFFTKQWPTANFAKTADFLAGRGIRTIAIASKSESKVLQDLKRDSKVPVTTFDDLTLPEITALAAKARIFIGNDSGIAHIAAAVGTPSVVIFGSSNRNHWRPWTDAPNEIVFNSFACQPCPGYVCAEFGEPACIQSVTVESVVAAIERVMNVKKAGTAPACRI